MYYNFQLGFKYLNFFVNCVIINFCLYLAKCELIILDPRIRKHSVQGTLCLHDFEIRGYFCVKTFLNREESGRLA